MAQQTTLDCILEAISGDESLREALWAHFLPGTNQNTEVDGQHVDAPIVTSQETNPYLASQIGQSGGGLHWLRTHSNQAALTATIVLVPMLTHWSVIYASWEIVTLL